LREGDVSQTIEIKELAARFTDALVEVAAGGEVIVTEGGIPRARLVGLNQASPRVAGLHAGALQMSDDFDAPLPEDFWAGTS
jgi:antitoxin (DNA-binding transcriptional repressor) of toxin-antitoxin stability system